MEPFRRDAKHGPKRQNRIGYGFDGWRRSASGAPAGRSGRSRPNHGRDRHRGKQVVDQIQAAGQGSAIFLPADLSSLAEVRRLADMARQDCDRLNVLMRGSVLAAPRGSERPAWRAMSFAVNYLAGFLLTRLLLPLMKVSEPARIVNVSSLAQQPIDFDDVMLTRGYTGGRAYAQSKLAQIMFTFDLARELDLRAITANSVHPATYMATTMVRQSGVTPVSSVSPE